MVQFRSKCGRRFSHYTRLHRRTDRFCDVLGSHVGSLDPKKGKNSISSSRHHHLFGWWKKSIKISFRIGDPSVRSPVYAIDHSGRATGRIWTKIELFRFKFSLIRAMGRGLYVLKKIRVFHLIQCNLRMER